MRYLLIGILLIGLSGCSVKATKGITKDGMEWMRLDGLGAESAKFKDGSEIHKRETLRVPEIMPTSR